MSKLRGPIFYIFPPKIQDQMLDVENRQAVNPFWFLDNLVDVKVRFVDHKGLRHQKFGNIKTEKISTIQSIACFFFSITLVGLLS
jgi:hypothetical protein